MNELSTVESRPLAAVSMDIGQIIQAAIASGRPMSELKEAFDLYERMEAVRRESLFNQAFAKFKQECPPIVCRRENPQYQVTRDGVKKPRKYADLEDVSVAVDKPLHANGLYYSWTDPSVSDGGSLSLFCVLRHSCGRSEQAQSAPFPIEGGSDYIRYGLNSKGDTRGQTSASPQQRILVAQTYARLDSLLKVLGVVTNYGDDFVDNPTSPPVTPDQVAELTAFCTSLAVNEPALWKFLSAKFRRTIGNYADIRQSEFGPTMAEIKKVKGKPA